MGKEMEPDPKRVATNKSSKTTKKKKSTEGPKKVSEKWFSLLAFFRNETQ